MGAPRPANEPLLRCAFSESQLRAADQMGRPRLEFVLDEVKAVTARDMPVRESLDVATATGILVVIYTT